MIVPEQIGSPAYLFDLDHFAKRCDWAKEQLGGIPLTYSMKANPFLLNELPDSITHVEVCSPGELEICERMQIDPARIIYSGVMKEAGDVREAVSYGVDILTAESLLHVQLENEAVLALRRDPAEKRKVILRLTGGNQFGMSKEDLMSILREPERYEGLDFYGIHYFTGTQKKLRQVKKDIQRLTEFLQLLQEELQYKPRLVEYGPGASAEYFAENIENCESAEQELFTEVCSEIRALAEVCPLGVEMGRFLASGCGDYLTRICDSKTSSETNYLIVDGGIHHLKYYGQNMAMQVPPITVLGADGSEKSAGSIPYTLCGSLCTVADILVREVELPDVKIGDYLLFHRCGAYSVTEGTVLFLSRTMPRIYVKSAGNGLRLVREFLHSSNLNLAGGELCH